MFLIPELELELIYKWWFIDAEEVPLTTYVVADLDSEAGISMMREAILSLVSPILPKTYIILY